MAAPAGLKAIDLMLGIPRPDNAGGYDFLQPLLMDQQSREQFAMPAQYMFKDIPKTGRHEDYIQYTVDQMDAQGIEFAMLAVGVGAADRVNETALEALQRFPERFIASYEANPNAGMDEVRKIRRLHEQYDLKAVCAFPAGLHPQVPVNDKKWYPIYTVCVDLDIPFCPCMGVPGPRIPMDPQRVELIDEVCWFFPELRIVMRHGCEPWTDLAVKLMLKYPNLHYMTSAFAPRHYPKNIIDYANTRGSEKILYAGYFPAGLSLERIFKELKDVPLRDEVWPKFLRNNAIRVFKLEDRAEPFTAETAQDAD
jgi:predicted TIM-barrel fold metal-dependent hydrolase